MPAKVSADQDLEVSTGIAKVWKANPAMAPGKTPEKVALKDYQDSIKAVADLNDQIEELRHQLSGLIDDRDDAALTLSALQYEGAERDSRHLRAGQLGI